MSSVTGGGPGGDAQGGVARPGETGEEHHDTRVPIEAPLLSALFEQAAVGIYATDAEGRVTACNPHSERLLGYAEGDVVGKDVHALVHRFPDGSVAPLADCRLREVITAARAAEGVEFFARADATLIPVRWAAAPILLAGSVTGSVVVFTDETASLSEADRRSTEHNALSAAYERLTLLADAAAALTGTLDATEALRRLARVVVPRVGDAATVDVLRDGGVVERMTVAHRDPLRAVPPPGPIGALLVDGIRSEGPWALVLADGEPTVLSAIQSPQAARNPFHRAQLELLEELGAQYAIVAPLRARGRVLGTLTVARTDPARPYGPPEVDLVTDLADRAALVADNARLYGEQRATAEALQRNLLPRLPSTRQLSLTARYLPARTAAEIGGDWYDAFRDLDGALALVIGDVVGHGLSSVARMSELRNLLRGIALSTQAPPSVVLSTFDRAVTHLSGTGSTDIDPSEAELATLVFARLEGTPGGPRRLTWSNAGHPPPLLMRADGTAEYLDQPAGVLIGLGDDGLIDDTRVDAAIDVEAGTTLLLYTDGLVETPGRSIIDGLDTLQHHASALAHQPLDPFCDQLLQRVAPSGTDDIALLAARVEQ